MNRRTFLLTGTALTGLCQSTTQRFSCQEKSPQVSAGPGPANYDESKVGIYSLPNPLIFANGTRVQGAGAWYKLRRQQILHLFHTNVYGRTPARLADMHFEVFDTDRYALGNTATRKQVTVYFSGRRDSPKMDLLIYLPNNAPKPVPLILTLNFTGNHTVISDPEVKLGIVWAWSGKICHRASEKSRGSGKVGSIGLIDWPGAVAKILAHGFGVATAYYGDIEPDFEGGWRHGVRALFREPTGIRSGTDEWGAIGAWAWGLSRAMDYLETDNEVDSHHVAIMGHSRLGKTALWAGAQDRRFAMVLSSCAGEGGDKLARRNYGETIGDITARFPYWFCMNYAKYRDQAGQLPVDQHELIALIAPRPVYQSTAQDDHWADPKGEFLAAVAAGPVFQLVGAHGLNTDEMPRLNHPIMHTQGFHYRTGKHGVTAYDWDQFLTFASIHFQAGRRDISDLGNQGKPAAAQPS